jgi:hypothetical protein
VSLIKARGVAACFVRPGKKRRLRLRYCPTVGRLAQMSLNGDSI